MKTMVLPLKLASKDSCYLSFVPDELLYNLIAGLISLGYDKMEKNPNLSQTSDR